MRPRNSNFDGVVLVGGGFAGLTTALALNRYKEKPPVILIEPRSRFVFLPLLYELLSGEMKDWEVAPAYTSLINKVGISWLKDRVISIDANAQHLITANGLRLHYDQLVLSTGSKPVDLGTHGVKDHALFFHSFEDVEILRKRIEALRLRQVSDKAFVIVGAGPTGVELACKLADLLDKICELHLIELGDRVLPNSKSFNQEQAEKALCKRGVKVHLCTKVVSISSDQIELQLASKVQSQTKIMNHLGLVWTVGSKPVFPLIHSEVNFDSEKLPIDRSLQVRGLSNVLALGDSACHYEDPYPSTAQVAMQQGELAAKVLIALRANQKAPSFEFNDFGEMLSLGLGDASITGMGLTLSGPLAFHMRRMAYLTKFPSLSLGLRSTSAWLLGN